jgi:predicted ATP-dependent serine protease
MADEMLYKCPECGLHYVDENIAKQCETYCKEYNSCSLEITKQSIERNKATENPKPY